MMSRFRRLTGAEKDVGAILILFASSCLFFANVLLTDQVLVGDTLARYIPWDLYVDPQGQPRLLEPLFGKPADTRQRLERGPGDVAGVDLEMVTQRRAAKKEGGGNTLLFAALAVILLVGAGVGGYFLFVYAFEVRFPKGPIELMMAQVL